MRPFVLLRSLNGEPGCLNLRYFGEFVSGPHEYPKTAIKHNLCTNAYFNAALGKVRYKRILHVSKDSHTDAIFLVKDRP